MCCEASYSFPTSASVQNMYRIPVIFRGSKFSQIAVFDNFVETFCEYAIEAGDGAKCQNFC